VELANRLDIGGLRLSSLKKHRSSHATERNHSQNSGRRAIGLADLTQS